MPTFKLLQGHWLDVAKSIPDKSVHVCATSPPYFNLRSYKTEPQIWDGDPNCEHVWQSGEKSPQRNRNGPRGGLHEGRATNLLAFIREPSARDVAAVMVSTCDSCGAMKCELGQEKTPTDFVRHLVRVFREVRRVLRDDGLLWVNIADSYASIAGGYDLTGSRGTSAKISAKTQAAVLSGKQRRPAPGLKSGDMNGVPWVFALAMRDDGWWLRRDIIWAKKNSLPESVQGTRWERHRIKLNGHQRDIGWSNSTEDRPQSDSRHTGPYEDTTYVNCEGCEKCKANDGLILRRGSGRCTSNFEYIFMFAKTADYYYDSIAVQEPCESGPADIKKMIEGKDRIGGRAKTLDDRFNAASAATHIGNKRGVGDPAGRNRRSVWTIGSTPYAEDHYAAYPAELPTICIQASTSEHGCCANCQAPYARIIDKSVIPHDGATASAYDKGSTANRLALLRQAARERGEEYQNSTKTLGWKRTCECETNESVPATVLDPFCGRGTTGVAAIRLARDFIGVDLQPNYLTMSRKNILAESPLFTTEI